MNNLFFLSVVISSNKPNLWKRVYDSFVGAVKNPALLEFIFVGPKIIPTKEVLLIKDNKIKIVYIKTRVKPAQCWEIGIRQAKGKYILPSCDDCTISGDIIKLLQKKESEKDISKDVIGIKFRKTESYKIIKNFYFFPRIKNFPSLAHIGIYNRKTWYDLKGVDKNFVALYGSIDMQLRFMENGGKVYFLKKVIMCEKIKYQKKYGLHLNSFSGYDKKLLKSLWVKENKTFSNKRLKKVEPFNNKNILNKTEGPTTIFSKKSILTWE